MNRHRIFGLTLSDLFLGTRYRVEMETDLSIRQQYVDVVIIEKTKRRPRALLGELPEGLENLRRFNLLTYKSLHEPLIAWTLDELLGHLVNYRKQMSAKAYPKSDRLLPEEDFQLYAVCTRKPRKLAQQVELRPLVPGVYEVTWGVRVIRLIVLNEVAQTERNAFWQIFSNIPANVQFGADHYPWRRRDHSSIVNELFESYHVEVPPMPYTLEDYYVEKALEQKDKVLARLPIAERLKGVPVDERLKGVPVDERLKGVPVDQRLKGVPVDERLKGVNTAELLKRLPREEIEAYLKKLRRRRAKK